MLAYLFWHQHAAGAERRAYEQELERFHRSLAQRPPSGFESSASFRIERPPWLADVPTPACAELYEDWYVIRDWAALGVLEEAAVSRGHVTAHARLARHAGPGRGAVYRMIEGTAQPGLAPTATWIEATPRPGHERPSLDALLGDGIDPARDGLWRRCLVLGPAPEYCLLAGEAPAGVAASRLPAGWSARTSGRERVWDG